MDRLKRQMVRCGYKARLRKKRRGIGKQERKERNYRNERSRLETDR